jgi:hypothetical protein
MLLKPTATMAHGGGKRLAIGSPEYTTIRRWIGQGVTFARDHEPALAGITVWPSQRILAANQTQQLRVVARYDDGSSADVTRLAQYESNVPDLANVDDRGLVQARAAFGPAPILARFGGRVAVARMVIPAAEEPPGWEPPASENLIDPFIFGTLRSLKLVPAAACTDTEFARRTALDICGTLPAPDEVAAFETEHRVDKRARWVDRMLERPAYADFFAMKWGTILRNQRTFGPISQPGTFAFHDWIRQAIADNMPYDRFVAAIVTARGDAAFHPPVVWFRQARSVEELTDDAAQLFLGVRLQCARCHQHPYERWGPDDYYGFVAFFSRIGRKPGLDLDPITPRLYLLPAGSAVDPATNRRHAPRHLDGTPLPELGPLDDPRQALADWLGRPDNTFFPRALVNRYWKHFFGRGLIEPEDDLRPSNPPSHPELLDALAGDFVRHGYDLKHLIRTIATSRAYDRSSLPAASDPGTAPASTYARFAPRRLSAEVLLDAIADVTGIPVAFPGLPRSFRAIQLPDDGFSSGFLDVFGRPRRDTVCECERSAEANLAQSLLLLSSSELQRLLEAPGGRIERWLSETTPAPDTSASADAVRIDELYRVCTARRPTGEERAACLDHLARSRARGKLRQGYEDLVWTLLNTKEFLFNH